MEILSILSDLDDEARTNLAVFVERELSREYAPKHKNKAAKSNADALVGFRLSGERIAAEVREAGKSYRIDMTFPLFDLANDYTLVLCTCQRDSLSLETQRCHHMYYVQERIRLTLSAMSALAPENPLAGLEAILETPEDEDRWLFEHRFRWVFDSVRWTLHFEKQSRSRYEANAEWHWEKTFTLEEWLKLDNSRPATPVVDPKVQLFDLLNDALEKSLPITDGHRAIALERSALNFEISSSDKGLSVKPSFAEKYLRIEGRGILSWYEKTASLIVIRLEPKEEQFLTYLLRMDKPFPIAHRDRVLELIGRMDTKVFRLAANNAGPIETAVYRPIVRLTPFKKGGMRIEVRLQLEAGSVVISGVGENTVPRLDGKGHWERDIRRELKLFETIVDGLNLDALPQPEAGVFIAFNDGKALECVAAIEKQKAQLDFIVEWPSFLAKKAYEISGPLKAQNLKVSLGEKKDWLSVEGWLELDDGHKLSLKEVLKTIQRRNNYLQLPDGRWSLIPEHFKDKLQVLVDTVEIADDDSLTIDVAALDDEARLAALEQFPFQESSRQFWSMVARARSSQQLAIPIPKGLTVEMRPYQRDGFRWLARLAEWGLGACLADDMGLGKTLQTLAVLLARQERGPSLVIAPSSLSYNWQSEAQKFAPDLKIIQMRELSRRGEGAQFQAGDVVVASYGMVMRYAEILAATNWNVLVLDEAQTIKNAQTKTAQAVQTIPADWKVALSGTPIENHLGDLWSLFRTLSPGIFGEWDKFKRSYVFPIEREDSQNARERLKGKIAPFVLRRMKKDYLKELPEKTEVDLWIDLNPEEIEAYDAIRGEAIDRVAGLIAEDPEAKTQMQILAALTRLRQAACHRSLIDESWQGGSSKVEALTTRLLELKESSHAALVFSQFTRFLGLIQKELVQLGFKVLYLDGQTPPKERLRLVEEFQNGDYDVFLISLKAGGTGLNLTRASYVFHMDPWWNPAIENQASDRAYRMGQKQAVTVYRLRSRGTIEEMIQAMHGDKRALVESVLEGRMETDRVQWKDLWESLWPKTKDQAASRKKPSSREEGLF